MIEDNLIKIFNEGPDVSLSGSPTVSPIMEACSASLKISIFLSLMKKNFALSL